MVGVGYGKGAKVDEKAVRWLSPDEVEGRAGPLKARGYDALAPYPKICAIQAALQAADGYKNYKGLVPPGPLKPEIVDAFFA